MAQWLQVSKSGYYAWRRRRPSLREQKNEVLLDEIRRVHEESHGVYGSRKICRKLNETSVAPVNHKRVERIMRENGIRSKTRRKYKATTNSHHNLPVAENILNRDFTANAPGQKMVSDITYIPTDEGWLYLAGVMDLCGEKIVGVSMDSRMTKELCMNALLDAISHTDDTKGCILHSDRGSQYCSFDYQALAKEYGFISSMSRKVNCWEMHQWRASGASSSRNGSMNAISIRGEKQKQPYLNIFGYFITVSGYMRLMDIKPRRHTTWHIKRIQKRHSSF